MVFNIHQVNYGMNDDVTCRLVFWGGRQSIEGGDCDEQIQDLQVGRRIIISPTININAQKL
jgi:hypothetical protein